MPRMPTFTIALGNAVKVQERLYFVLLQATLSHFSPHHRLLLAFVKRKHADFSKSFRKVCLPSVEEKLIFRYHQLWFFSQCISTLRGPSSTLGISNFGQSSFPTCLELWYS